MSKRFGELLKEANADLDSQAEASAAKLKKTADDGLLALKAKAAEINVLEQQFQKVRIRTNSRIEFSGSSQPIDHDTLKISRRGLHCVFPASALFGLCCSRGRR